MPRPASRLFVTVFLDLIGFGIIVPLLPSYGAHFTSSAALIGVLVAVDSLLTFLVAPTWGRLSDRIGRRPVLLIGLGGSVASYLIFAFAGSFALLMLSRVVSGATGATIHVAQAYLADITPPAKRSAAMGLIGAAFGLGFTVGPAIGGLSSTMSDTLPGIIAAAIAALNLVVAAIWLPETDVSQRPSYRPLPSEHSRHRALLAVMFASTFAFTAMYVSFPLFAQQALGYSRGRVSGAFVLVGLVTIIVQGRLIGVLAPRFGEARLVRVGSVLMAAGFGLFPFIAAHLAGMALSLILLTTGFCLVGPSLAALVSRRTGADDQGRALGMLQSVGAIARIVGPPALGLVQQSISRAAPFLVAGAVALVGAGASIRPREDAVPPD